MLPKKTTDHFKTLETPFYYYDLALLRQTLQSCKQAADRYGFCVHYALKANFNARILSTIQQAGLGADCVSGNEVLKAIEIGFEPNKIVFAGVGKSDKEIAAALRHRIFCFNVESLQELHIIDELATLHHAKPSIALRINPNIAAGTHKNITTGLAENKFGIHPADLPKCVAALKQSKNLQFIGLHFHIGSQIIDMDVFKKLCDKINETHRWFVQQGLTPRLLNVGGGLGVNYQQPDTELIPNFEAYFKLFDQHLERTSQQEIHFELGRSLVAQCGYLISRVLYVKNGLQKNFLILDAGMTELIRPALYHAYHHIENLDRTSAAAPQTQYDIVGPLCESTDCFAEDVVFPQSYRGDLIAIRTTGAYGEVMASNYNLREHVRSIYAE